MRAIWQLRGRTWGCVGLVALALLAARLPAGDSAAVDSAAGKSAAAAGKKVEPFTLRDYRGAEFRLDSWRDKPVVVIAFFGVECPLAQQYALRFRELADRYETKNVGFLAVNANVHDSLPEIDAWVRQHKLAMPVLKDAGNVLADKLGAQRTPEAFVLDRDRAVRYHGRIDDQFVVGTQKPKATQTFVADAIDALLAGKDVKTAATEPLGCVIGRVRTTKEGAAPTADTPTYSQEISRLLAKRCIECHRDGDIAPFALTKYEEVAGWAEMIDEVVRDQRMPPWHASEKHGAFRNDARLSKSEKELIARWVKAGAPEGDAKDLPPPQKFPEGWRISTPDQIIQVTPQPFDVPATGEVRYQYFVVDPGFKEDKWIRGAELQAGARSVVHHIIAFIKPPGVGRMGRPGTLPSDWLVATAPGARPMQLPESLAKFVPAGSKFVFQVHYTPNGVAQRDQSRLGIVFADPKKVRKEVGTWRAANHRFVIPPGAANHEVRATHTFHDDTYLLAMFPHMHLRGKSFRYEAKYPDGRQEILLDVPRYDFNWQNSYIFALPKVMPAGTQLLCTAHFDNSPQNLANPNPQATVRWGDQTYEEMMIGYFSMMLVDQDLTKQPHPRKRRDVFLERWRKAAEKSTAKDKLDPAVASAAKEALATGEKFDQLFEAVQAILPPVDRMDVSVIADGTLTVRHTALVDQIATGPQRRRIQLPAAGLALAKYAVAEQPTVDKDLSEATTVDLKFMSQFAASAVHVPIQVDGQTALLSFWSEDADAFPDEAVTLAKRIAAALGK